MAQREIEPAEQKKELARLVVSAEDTLRTIIPVPKPAAAQRLEPSIRTAEAEVGAAKDAGRRVDAIVGFTEKQLRERLEWDISRIRQKLEVMRGEEVGGVQRYAAQVDELKKSLGDVQVLLYKGDVAKAQEAFGSVQKGIEGITEAVGTARKLVAAGAPQELVEATDAVPRFAQGDARGGFILKAANTFLENKEYFMSAEGRPVLDALAGYMKAAAQGMDADFAKATVALDSYRGEMAYPSEQRAAETEAIRKGSQALGAATTEEIAKTVEKWSAEGEAGRAKALAAMTLQFLGASETVKKADAELESMKALLVQHARTGSQEAAGQFMDGMAARIFAGDVAKLNDTVSAWPAGAQRNVVEGALRKTGELVSQKKYEDAASLLTYAATYADSVVAAGIPKAKGGAPVPEVFMGPLGEMARALSAAGRGEASVEGRDIGTIFSESSAALMHAGQSLSIRSDYSEIRSKLEGKTPWVKGLGPGIIPLGAAPDGTQITTELSKLREFETFGDPLLKGKPVSQLLADCGRAAQSGDEKTYEKARHALFDRFALVVARYCATQLAANAEQLPLYIEETRKAYGGHPPPEAARRLDALEAKAKELAAGLRKAAVTDQMDNVRVGAVRDAVMMERIAAAIDKQMNLNDDYKRMASGATGAMAGYTLDASNEHFRAAKGALRNGDTKAAREQYEAAIFSRQSALATYAAYGKEKKLGESAMPLFNEWRSRHMEIFDKALGGRNVEALQQSTGLTELAVFAVPEKARGFLDLSVPQRKIRELALAGKNDEAAAAWDGMRDALEKQKFWTNAAATAAGIAIGFVPGGQLVSGAIFMSLATGHAAEEAAETGRVSAGSWAMIGVTAATLGLGGAVAGLSSAAKAAKLAGMARTATAYRTGAIGLTAAGAALGVGMTVMSIPSTIQAYREGKYGEVAFNVAMMAFPFAHMAGVKVASRISARRAESAAMLESAMKELGIEARTMKELRARAKELGVAAPGQIGEKIPESLVTKVERRAEKLTGRQAETTLRSNKEKAAEVVDEEKLAAWVAEQSRKEGLMIGDRHTGRILRAVERNLLESTKGGTELDVLAIGGDKRGLNWINNLFGTRWGDRTLSAYVEIIRRTAAELGADCVSYKIRVSGTSDETITVLAIKGGRGAEVRNALSVKGGTIERVTRDVLRERGDPAHPETIAPLLKLVKDPEKMVAGGFDISMPVKLARNAEGGVEAAYANGARKPAEGFLSRLATSAEEVQGGSSSFAPALREKLGIPEADTFIKDDRIRDLRENERGSGIAFEVRYEVTNRSVLEEIMQLLKVTDKGLAEIARNWFGIRGLNTFFGHYGTNSVLTIGERAIADYAAANGISLQRLGTHKYIATTGTRQQIEGLYAYVSKVMNAEGLQLKASNRGPVGKPLKDAGKEQALVSISNGHLERKWGPMAYDDANAFISAVGLANEETLAKLLGKDYNAMADIIGIIKQNPAIRNVEDLLIALRSPAVVGPVKGIKLVKDFETYVRNRAGRLWDMSVELAPRPKEAGVPAAEERGGRASPATPTKPAGTEEAAPKMAASPSSKTAETHTSLLLLDTSYVLERLKEGIPLYETFSRLSERGEVIITEQVMAEIEKNLPAFGSKVRKAAIDDIYKCVNERKISIEKIDIPPKYVAQLSKILEGRSEVGNRRVGLGEASLIRYAKTVGQGLFDDIRIMSTDSDVPLLLRGSNVKPGG